MKKHIFAGLAVALALFMVACDATYEAPPAAGEPPVGDIVFTPAPQQLQDPPPAPLDPPNPPEQEPTPSPAPPVPEPEPLPPALQYIVDAGRFEGRHEPFWGEAGHTTYINTALGMIYHFDKEAEGEGGRLFDGVFHPASDIIGGVVHPASNTPGELMRVSEFKDLLVMRVVYGSGEQWIRERTDAGIEGLTRMYRDYHERLRGHYSEEEFEEWRAGATAGAAEFEEFMRNRMGDYFEVHFGSHNYDEMAYWPVEYEIAGRIFTGLQLNVVIPESGFSNGRTHLFHQMGDVAIVITISSEGGAGAVARRHINRFDVIS